MTSGRLIMKSQLPSMREHVLRKKLGVGWIFGAVIFGILIACLIWLVCVVIYKQEIVFGPLLVAFGVSLPSRLWARLYGGIAALFGFMLTALVSLAMYGFQHAFLLVLLPNNEFNWLYVDLGRGFEYLYYGLSFGDLMVWLSALALTHILVLWRLDEKNENQQSVG